ncbi:MAG: preprotein translocase subunit SecA [Alphaproteobacteria bacterium]|nr:preprotein translocase subunit SecA [Alphaproteobacteria bacterium]
MKFRFFKSAGNRYLRGFKRTIDQINALEPAFEKLSDDALRGKTDEFRKRAADGESLNALLPEVFAVVREGAKRTLGLRPFDVQLLGGIVLHTGKIAEMKTGEGKTLVATLPVYLNALTGRGVHVVTVNDYLAKRDSEWMGKIYRFLGMSVGCITPSATKDERKAAYACDITYATNNDLGFDYLRDNMAYGPEDMVQRPFSYAIVDEVDSILIDEARTPLIISGPAEDSSERYISVDKVMKEARPEHYEKDEKLRSVTLTEKGTEFVENRLQETGLIQGSLYDAANVAWVHHVEQALRANTMFARDVDYIVQDGKIMIVDEFTGRTMKDRRYGNGLHQAIEAKEGVQIMPENQTVASITFQNYFRLYPKLAGMTGTAMTEADELDNIYKLEVIEIPTNRPCVRRDEQDVIYRTADEKYKAIIDEITAAHQRRQPVLVGTTSIEKSEILADLLKKKTTLSFNVLNARYHEQEARIIADAGVPGAITIATNMAGRGTDIQLGGNFEMRFAQEKEKNPEADDAVLAARIRSEIAAAREIVVNAGGLYILGSERHESRRIDNQLRGRSGRQGDPGLSKFFVSLQDDLMRIFGSERIGHILKTMGMPEGQSVIHPWISKAIAKAQQKVEAHHFDVRKSLLQYDDVANEQRKVIYEQRRNLMNADSVADVLTDMRRDAIQNLVYAIAPPQTTSPDWDAAALEREATGLLGFQAPFAAWVREPGMTPDAMVERLDKMADEAIAQKFAIMNEPTRRAVEKNILIQAIDHNWKEHLQMMDYLNTSIRLRAYAQQNPLNAYKQEAFLMFDGMLSRIRDRAVQMLCLLEFKIQPATPESGEHAAPAPFSTDEEVVMTEPKVARNAPCPCGSGKKYKHCCGKIA